MRPRRRAVTCALAALLLLPAVACSDGSDGRAWRAIGDIHYLVPDSLPEGWVVRSAIERTGRPQDEWIYRADVYRNPDREEYLVVIGELATELEQRGLRELGEHRPGPVGEVDADDLFYLLLYLGIAAPYEEDVWSGRGTGWGSGTLFRRVLLVGTGDHDDRVVERVAEQLVDARDLDFERPSAAEDAGYELVGSMTEPGDLPDHGITWTPPEGAGPDLQAARGSDPSGPSLSLNVYPRLLAQTGTIVGSDPAVTLPTDPDDAEVVRNPDGDLELRVLLAGIGVVIRGKGVEPEALRALARSLRPVPHDVWVAYLGDRLTVDEPDPRD